MHLLTERGSLNQVDLLTCDHSNAKIKRNPCNDKSKTLNFVVTDEQDKTKQLPFPQLQFWKWGVWTRLQPPPHSLAVASMQSSNSQTPCEHKGWLSLTLEENCKQGHLLIKEMNHWGKKKNWWVLERDIATIKSIVHLLGKKHLNILHLQTRRVRRYFTEFTWNLCSIFSSFPEYCMLAPH